MSSLLVPLSERDHLLDGEPPSSALPGSPVLSVSRRTSLPQAARVSTYTFVARTSTASALSPQMSSGRSDLQLAGIGSTPNLELRAEHHASGIFDEKMSEAEYEKMSLFEGLNYHVIDNEVSSDFPC